MTTLRYLAIGLILTMPSAASHAADWSQETHYLVPGDYDGDGRTDLLVKAKDPLGVSAIVLSDSGGEPTRLHQSWDRYHLSPIDWSGDTYLPIAADFDGDGRDDLFLQRTSGGNHYILLSAGGQFNSIDQTISNTWAGASWSQADVVLHVGDFNGDNRADVLLQAKSGSAETKLFLAATSGSSLLEATPAQTWPNEHVGFRWSERNAELHVGDFDGDCRADLFVQAYPKIILIPYEIAIPVPVYEPGSYGIALSEADGTFTSAAQSWGRDHAGVDWSPRHFNAVIGNFDGDTVGSCGRDDIFLQSTRTGTDSRIVMMNTGSGDLVPASGNVQTISDGYLSTNWSEPSYGLIAGNFDGLGGDELYLQGASESNPNRIATTDANGNIVSVKEHDEDEAKDPTLPTAVGATAGEFSVTPSGTASYRVPITVPPGVAGVAPELALAYNSGSGKGLVGVGWTVGGLSTINRCPATFVHDGFHDGVDLDGNDRFCLDGQRLVQTGTGPGYVEYRTEIDSFQRVRAYPDSVNPTHFSVWDKGGLIRSYGETADSRIEAANKAQALVYAINLIRDRFDNYIEFVYTEYSATSSYVPAQIRYGHSWAGGTGTAVGRVTFETTSRSDISYGFIKGSATGMDRRLSKIITATNDDGSWRDVRDYRLSYKYDSVTALSILMSITECELTDNTCFAPTRLQWQSGRRGFADKITTTVETDQRQDMKLLDVNNDGFTDIAYKSNGNWYVRDGRQGGLAGAVLGSPRTVHATDYAFAADMNGDGYGDIVQASDDDNGAARGVIQYLPGGPSGLGAPVNTAMTYEALSNNSNRTAVLDANGDSLPDIAWLTRAGDKTTLHMYVSDSTSPGQNYSERTIALWDEYFGLGDGQNHEVDGASLRVLNFDSDGLADLLIYVKNCYDTGTYTPPPEPVEIIECHNQWRVYSLVNDQIQQRWASNQGQEMGNPNTLHPKITDVNGDGLSDLLYFKSQPTIGWHKWSLWRSTGVGLGFAWNSDSIVVEECEDWDWDSFDFTSDNSEPCPGLSGSRTITLDADLLRKARPFDYNHDGHVDLLIPVHNGTSTNWQILQSTGTGFATHLIDTGTQAYEPDAASTVDLSGDGLADLISSDPDNPNSNFRINYQRGPASAFVQKITDGLGAETEIAYLPLTDGQVYGGHEVTPDNDSEPTFPYRHAASPTYVVSRFGTDNGLNDGFVFTFYEYFGAKLHQQGRGPTGFSRVVARNENTQRETINVQMQLFPFTGMLKQSIEKLPDSASSSVKNSTHSMQISYAEACEAIPETCSIIRPSVSSWNKPEITVGQTLTETSNTYESRPTAAPAVFPYVTVSEQTEYPLVGDGAAPMRKTKTEYLDASLRAGTPYSAYGNSHATRVTVTNGSGGEAHVTTTKNVYTDHTNGDEWCLARLSRAEVTHSRSDYYSGGRNQADLSVERISEFTYDAPQRCVLKTETTEPGGTLRLTKTYDYDAFGNVTRETISGFGVATRSSSTGYGSDHRFPTSATNALNQTSTQVFDAAYGNVETAYDINGISVSSRYDGFGRKIRTSGPETGRFSETEIHWCGTWTFCTADEAVYTTTTTGSDGSRSVTEYDRLGRELVQRSVGFDGREVVVDRRYDPLGREYLVSAPRYAGDSSCWTYREFDQRNRVVQEHQPASVSECTSAVIPYNGINTGLSRVTDFDHDNVVDHLGNKLIESTTTGPEGRRVNRATNIMDRVISVYETDDSQSPSLQVRTSYDHDVFGNLTWVEDAAGNETHIAINKVGHKTGMNDPDMGAWTYSHNVLGELRAQTDAKGQITEFDYDLLGRMIRREEGSQVTTWEYDTAMKGKGKLAVVTGPFAEMGGPALSDFVETHSYDSLGRPTSVVRKIEGGYFWHTQAYDAQGRVAELQYPAYSEDATATDPGTNRFRVTNTYNSHGYLATIKDAGSGKALWTANATDALGNASRWTLGNGLVERREYSRATGFLEKIETGKNTATDIQNFRYLWYPVGNLHERHDDNNNLHETFAYDSLHRLRSTTLNSPLPGAPLETTYSYDVIGNLKQKGSFGGYNYTSPVSGCAHAHSQPHAVKRLNAGGSNREYCYDANGNLESDSARSLDWTHFNKPATIMQGNLKSEFSYGPSRSRYKHVATRSDRTDTTVYVGGNYERVSSTEWVGWNEHRHSVFVGGRVITLHTERTNGTQKTEYLHRDHLESVATMTDANGLVLEEYSYDPFGKRRDPNLWESSQPGVWPLPSYGMTAVFHRGFTGHEHLDHVGLIHMNGRVYDPEIGRFLSADVFIQFPESTQGLNRYAYVGNNPLSYNDPSGHFASLLVAAAFQMAGASPLQLFAVNVIAAGVEGFVATGNLTGAIKGAALAAAAAGVSAKIGQLSKLHGLGDASTALLHGTSQGGLTRLGGGSFKDGFIGGFVGSISKPLTERVTGSQYEDGIRENVVKRAMVAAIIGGTSSAMVGGRFANGAASAAFVSAFNGDDSLGVRARPDIRIEWLSHPGKATGKERTETTTREKVRYVHAHKDAKNLLSIAPPRTGLELAVEVVKLPYTADQYTMYTDIEYVETTYREHETNLELLDNLYENNKFVDTLSRMCCKTGPKEWIPSKPIVTRTDTDHIGQPVHRDQVPFEHR